MNKSTDNKPAAATDGSEKPAEEQPGVSLLVGLRKLMPTRRLAYWEHLVVAERQAGRLLSVLGQTEPGISLAWLSENSLGNIQVVMGSRWKMEGISGMTTWEDGRWIIGVNKGNPHVRRRFTLCHEFKHVLDANRDKITYEGISPNQRELIANYFAACYLMPKPMVRKAWTNALQDVEALAGLFKVSTDAMDKRLRYLQFIDTEPNRPVGTYFRRQSAQLRRADGADNEPDEHLVSAEVAA